jgi:hypothetical protein
MARIKNTDVYVFDIVPEVSSFLVGSDQGDGRITKSYRIDALFGLAETEGFIKEAPIDGQPYLRQDGDWELVPPSGVGSVFSVFGRTGAVTGLVGDYSAFYALVSHTHLEADITDLQSYLLPTDIGTTVQAWSAALDAVSGTNTGDQTSIVGITGTKAQFNTALTDGNFIFVGDAPTAHTHVEADITDLQNYLLAADIDTLLELNTIITDATLIDTADSRLSDARTPLAHTHVEADITDLGAYLLSVDMSDINAVGTPSISTWLRGDGTWGTILAGVSSVFGRTATVVATAGDYDAFYYTETEMDASLALKSDTSHTHTLSTGATDVTATFGELNLLDLSALTAGWVLSADTASTASWKQLSHTLLSNVGSNTHAQIDTHIADSTIHFTEASISITESQISDFGTYLPASSYTAADVLAKLLTVDGSGSGLDADLLDGVSSAGFVAVGGDTMTGNLILNDAVRLELGTGGDADFYYSNSSNAVVLDLITANSFIIRDNGIERATFTRSSGDFVIDGDMTASVFRATSSTDASLTSTAHGFQIGSTSSTNLIMDNNELMARNNGLAAALSINRDGGSVAIGAATAAALTVGSTVTATNFILSSDERLKKNILSYKVKPINANWKTFEFKDAPEENRRVQLGVIAQELEIEHPEFVMTDDEGYKSVAYTDLLIAKNAELEQRIERLEGLLNTTITLN